MVEHDQQRYFMSRLTLVPYSNRPVLSRFYKSNREKVRIQRNDQCYALYDDRGDMIAAVKFTPLPDGSWLLRNMLVDQAYRGQQLGHRLLSLLRDTMRELAKDTTGGLVTRLYCYPWANLTRFYTQHGFVVLDVEADSNSMTPFSDVSESNYSQEVIQRFQAYRRRGLDIQVCAWMDHA